MKKKATSRKLRSDWKQLSSAASDQIDTSEIPEIRPEQFARAVIRRGLKPSPTKVQLTIRVDRDVLEWYRKRGHGYQTRINKLLRAYMEAHLKGVS